MPITPINAIISTRMQQRHRVIRHYMENPREVQMQQLSHLLSKAKNTLWGKAHGFGRIKDYETFCQNVPLQEYEDVLPFIDRIRAGEQNILWPTHIKWFAKSSGTTSQRSKFIPVSQEAIEQCHFRGGKDLLSVYCTYRPDTRVFNGLSLRLGGSTTFNSKNHETYYGDLSAILIENLPFWVEIRSTPNQSIALMEEWESKLNKIVDRAITQNITSLFGVSSWMLLLCKLVKEKTGADNLLDVWPNMELYGHGGVSFGPYRKQFQEMFPGPQVTYLESYNASEGIFAMQDQVPSVGMLLMLNLGIFFEFIPMTEYHGKDSRTVPLWEVEKGVNYAMVISTNSGLWRYIIGDTVKFTSTQPYRIEISGRTKLFINAFGEEVIIDNAEKAIAEACTLTEAEITDFTAAPRYIQNGHNGAHEWLIEFKKQPTSLDQFASALDAALRQINSDYDAKRHKDMALAMPQIHLAKTGLFYNWLKDKGKLGGQHKIPRLCNDRYYLDELLKKNI